MRLTAALVVMIGLAGCMATEEVYEDEVSVLPEIYLRTDVSDAEKDAELPEDMRLWKWNVLDQANFLSTIQMRRDVLRKIREIDHQVFKLRQLRPPIPHGLTEKLIAQRRLERMKFDLIQLHVAKSPLPADTQEKLREWRMTVLSAANQESLQRMRKDSAERIKWLRAKIQDLDKDHPDVAWDNYVHYSLQLHFEIRKLGLIETKI